MPSLCSRCEYATGPQNKCSYNGYVSGGDYLHWSRCERFKPKNSVEAGKLLMMRVIECPYRSRVKNRCHFPSLKRLRNGGKSKPYCDYRYNQRLSVCEKIGNTLLTDITEDGRSNIQTQQK